MKVELFWVDGVEKRLAMMARPRGGDWLDDEISSLSAQGINTLVSLLCDAEIEELELTGEAAACERQGIDLLRYPIEDRSIPSNARAFRVLIDELMTRHQQGQRIAIHCRMGIGRASVVTACLLHRIGVAAPNAFDQIGVVRGCTVPDTPRQIQWVTRFVETH